MDNKTVWETLESIKDLPTLPSVYFKVDKLLKDKQAQIENVARLIEMDAAMATSILRLINSAFYGLQAKSSSISHAVMMMGFNTVKNAIVSVAVLDTLSVKGKIKGFDQNDFWRHSVSVAVLARQLAEKSRLVPPEDAFIAGLLHDIGKIIMVKYFREDLEKIWQRIQETNCSFSDAEADVASIDHVQIGAYLARKWQLPEPIIEAIAGHHFYMTSSKSSGLVECIMVADKMANNHFQIQPDDFVFEDHIEKALKPLITNTDTWLPAAEKDIDTACDFFLDRKP